MENLRLLKALPQAGRHVSSQPQEGWASISLTSETKVVTVHFFFSTVHFLHVCYIGLTSVLRFTISFKLTEVIIAMQLCI